MRPTGGRQTFRIAYPDAETGAHGTVKTATPVLEGPPVPEFQTGGQRRFFDLTCNTETFVFSQQIGGLNHD
jgi:GntR family transcriptional regulator